MGIKVPVSNNPAPITITKTDTEIITHESTTIYVTITESATTETVYITLTKTLEANVKSTPTPTGPCAKECSAIIVSAQIQCTEANRLPCLCPALLKDGTACSKCTASLSPSDASVIGFGMSACMSTTSSALLSASAISTRSPAATFVSGVNRIEDTSVYYSIKVWSIVIGLICVWMAF